MNLFFLKKLKEKAIRSKDNLVVLGLALRDKRVPLSAKLLIGLVILYALSPIDLIPDFIPILGYVDDLILLPLGIYLALKLVPPSVLIDLKEKAKTLPSFSKIKWAGLFILGLWAFLVGMLILYLFKR